MDKGITQLPGIGSTRAKYFEKLGVYTVEQLATLYPHRYENIGNVIDISGLAAHRGEKITLHAAVCGIVSEKRIGGGRILTSVPVSDDSGQTVLTYFNNKFIKNSLHDGMTLYFYGRVSDSGLPTVYNPEIYRTLPENGGLLAVYPLTAGLSQNIVRKAVDCALGLYTPADALPDRLRADYGLCTRAQALKAIHRPRDEQDIIAAHRRLIFEELLYFSLGLQLMKSREREKAAVTLSGPMPLDFLMLHAFRPTDGQNDAMTQIYSDLSSGYAMRRLLQGDVGSGKTLVAGQAAYCVIRAGGQAIIMAPTEVLAQQHYRYFTDKFSKLGITTVLLTSSIPAAQKKAVKAQIRDGSAKLIIGTHAILQNDVVFFRPALVITDEQHRFGVMQRACLTQKGQGVHLLAMSATPIPRTLALMLWGDLELSTINVLPSGRLKTETYLVNHSYMPRILEFIRKNVEAGDQVYYVCPMVEGDEQDSLSDVKTTFEKLTSVLGGIVGLVHGKMRPAEKEKAMLDFADGKTKILVSTTVIEVGINVPSATLMIIDNAERFGLSQLHQLRGRVGRGDRQACCVLISDSKSDAALQRMRFFAETSDGFKIAQKDLELRGPGNFFGAQQHGLPQLKLADLNSDMQLFESAAECARQLLKNGIDRYPLIRDNVFKLFESKGEIFN